MKILAFSASNSSQSINRALIDVAVSRLQERHGDAVEITVVNIHDYEMPIYSFDREQESGIPGLAHKMFDQIGQADLLLISFAEHNGHATAAWKNIFDWMSRIDSKVWQGNDLVFLAASPGGGGGASVLKSQTESAPFFGGTLVASMGVGRWLGAYDAETRSLTNPDDSANLDDILSRLAP